MRNFRSLISALAAAFTLYSSQECLRSAEVAVPFPSFDPPRASQLVVHADKPDASSLLMAADTAPAPAERPGSAGVAAPAGGDGQQQINAGGPIAVAVPTAVPMAPAQAAIAILVPLVIALLKKWIPLHKAAIPYLSLGIGAALGVIDAYTGAFGGNPIATTLLGPAGTGLREIYDQTKKLAVAPEPPATA